MRIICSARRFSHAMLQDNTRELHLTARQSTRPWIASCAKPCDNQQSAQTAFKCVPVVFQRRAHRRTNCVECAATDRQVIVERNLQAIPEQLSIAKSPQRTFFIDFSRTGAPGVLCTSVTGAVTPLAVLSVGASAALFALFALALPLDFGVGGAAVCAIGFDCCAAALARACLASSRTTSRTVSRSFSSPGESSAKWSERL